MLYPFELRAHYDQFFRSELEQVEASPLRNACQHLHCDFTAWKAQWPGRLCGWVLRLQSQIA